MCRWVDERAKMQWMESLVGGTKFQLNKEPSLLTSLNTGCLQAACSISNPIHNMYVILEAARRDVVIECELT